MLNYKNMEHFNLKILADIPCQIIIDNAYKGDVCPDSLEKIYYFLKENIGSS